MSYRFPPAIGIRRNTSLTPKCIAVLFLLATLAAPTALVAQVTFTGGALSTPVAPAAGLNGPQGVAVDLNGNIYVTESVTHRLSEFNAAGLHVIDTELTNPETVAADTQGNIYVADTGGNRVVKYSPGHGFSIVAKGLDNPWGVTVDRSGNVFIADTYNQRILKETPAASGYIQTVAASLTYDPFGVAVDQAGNLYITDYFNGALYLEAPSGGSYQSFRLITGLNEPIGVTVDSGGNVLVAEAGSDTITKCVIGMQSVLYTTTLTTPPLNNPVGIWSDRNGNLYIANPGGNDIAMVSTESINFGLHYVLPKGTNAGTSIGLDFVVPAAGGPTMSVLTQGISGLDFNLANQTCQPWTPDTQFNLCQMNVAFTPTAPGLRRGAVVFTDSQGYELLSVPIFGIGNGPQAAFSVGAPKVFGTGFNRPRGVAVDGAGNLYIADSYNSQVVKVTPANVQTVVASGYPNILGVAVDGAGNVYFPQSNSGVGSIVKATPDGTQIVIQSGLNAPSGLALDGSGNLYIAEFVLGTILKLTPGGVLTTVASGLTDPTGLAVDAAGNLYIADTNGGVVDKLTPSGVRTTIDPGINSPQFITVDGAGNVDVSAWDSGIFQIAPNGLVTVIVPATPSLYYFGMAIDAAGNLYVSRDGSGAIQNQVAEFPRASPPAVTFPTTAGGSTSTADPQVVTVENIGNGNLKFSSLTYPKDFPEAAGEPDSCAFNTGLYPAGSCILPIDFTPVSILGATTSFTLNESVHFTTNTLNATNVGAQVPVSGSETKLASKIALSPLATTMRLGESIFLSAQVSPAVSGGPTPSGTVNFYSNGVLLGSSPVSASGIALLKFIPTALALDSVTANYYGSAEYAQNTTTLPEKITVQAKQATTVALASSANPSVHGVSVTFTATVAETIAATLPTGSVSFYADGTLLGTGVINTAGKATFATSTLTAATHAITASYPGDANYLTATSTALQQKVNP